MPEIRNPNLQTQGPGGGGGSGSGGGDMRVMLGLTLVALLAVTAFQYFKPKPAEPLPAQQMRTQSSPMAPAAPGSGQTPPGGKAGATAAPQLPAIAAASETETTVENEFYKITFTNRGGQVKRWILKRYYDSGGVGAGHNLDMVQQEAAARFGYPLSLFTYDATLTSQLNSALYKVSADGDAAANGSYLAPASLTFHYSGNGLDVLKTFRFDASYVVGIETEVKRNGEPVRALVEWPAGLGDMEEFGGSRFKSASGSVRTSAASQFVWSIDGKLDTLAAPKVSNNATLDQPFQYAAISDLYFAAAFLPEVPARSSVVTLHNSVDLPTDLSDPNSQKRPADMIGFAMGDASGTTRLRLYAGPKAMDTLTSIHAIGGDGTPTGQSLEPLIQFGWLTIIAKPLYLALRFLYEHGIPNWGWAIIVITIIFNLALLPTRLMMMKSSLKMMRIQPKVDVIKRKYASLKATDPKRAEMNTEMMALYKDEGVNMYGSCLPLLLQMPLFFAYYRVLANVIELRQAHWFWLHDLSMPDPLHFLPILIILTMFLTQYMTPSPGMDPAQRRMMAFLMPIIFGYSMLHFPSGLALYWGTGNIINLVMQLSINQSSMGKEMHAIAAKRAFKKSGGNPKTLQGRR